MNRRNFMRSLGAAVAAAMLPFARPVKLSAPKKAKNTFVVVNYRFELETGLMEQLKECTRIYELEGPKPADLLEIANLMHSLREKRPTPDVIELQFKVYKIES